MFFLIVSAIQELKFYFCYCAQIALSLAVALDRLRFGKARNKNFVFFLHLHSACTIFASILWVAECCPPCRRHFSESVFSFILSKKIANFSKSIG